MIGYDLQPDTISDTKLIGDEGRQALGRIRQQIREQGQAGDLALHNI